MALSVVSLSARSTRASIALLTQRKGAGSGAALFLKAKDFRVAPNLLDSETLNSLLTALSSFVGE